jgi:hypothetical protein
VSRWLADGLSQAIKGLGHGPRLIEGRLQTKIPSVRSENLGDADQTHGEQALVDSNLAAETGNRVTQG